MSRRLVGAVVGGDARALAPPDPATDAFTAQRVAEASEAAYAQGLADGRRAAVGEASEAARLVAERITAGLGEAVGEVLGELRRLRAGEALADVELARDLAEIILGREPHDDGRALLARCQEALSRLDDRPLEVRCHPEDAAVLTPALTAGPTVEGEVTVVEDAALAPGEARIAGRWAHVELTHAAAWRLIDEVLEVGEDGRG